MLRGLFLAGTLAVATVPVAAQQSGYYGGTGPERRFAREFYEAEQEKGIEYVSVTFRLATLTLYPTEELYRAWMGDEEKAKEELGAYARRLLVPVREKKARGTIKVTVRVRYPNARRSYDRLIATLTSTEGLDGEVELEVKGEH